VSVKVLKEAVAKDVLEDMPVKETEDRAGEGREILQTMMQT
jgi:hypothetical protein